MPLQLCVLRLKQLKVGQVCPSPGIWTLGSDACLGPQKDMFLSFDVSLDCSYPHVNVTNFTSSWKDGLAFNALIHKHR